MLRHRLILNAYTIVLATLLVPAGRLADGLGLRQLFLAGITLFGERHWDVPWHPR